MSEPLSPASFIAPDPAELAPLFPGYEIGALIATGGMGAVYQAIQKSLDRTVAIKILPHEFSADAAFCAGFEAEAKAMARLNHPNLIGVYDFGEVSGMLYIIMEFVPGLSLFHSANGTAIDPAEVIRIVTGICSGLAHAHDNGIIHRDIKPANILLDLNANPKIGDFGLARPADRQIQEGEEIFGTPHYTAPEVVNSPQNVDHRADIFSVGVILHELLTGHLPAEDHRTASAISHCDPRFDAIIRRATDPIPENRYSSAHEIERELHIIASSAGPRVLKTAVPVAPRGVRRLSGKNSSGNPALVLLVIAVLAAAAVYLILAKKNQLPAKTVPDTAAPAAPQAPAIPHAPEPVKPGKPITARPPEPPAPAEVEPAIPDPPPEVLPVPEETHVPETPSVPDEEPPEVLPKFDVPAFLERARAIMRERTAPLIAARDKALKDNLARFEREAKRLIRKIESHGARDTAEEALEDLIKDCERDENRIPAEILGRLKNIRGMEEAHEESYENQETIDLDLNQSFVEFSSTYTQGLEKQIERLQSEDDPAAIEAIKEEIAKIRDNKTYFPDLMLGAE